MKIDRLLLSKYLFQNGQDFLRRDDPYSHGLAVSLFQDAVEALLYYIAVHVDSSIPKKPGFLDYWKIIKDAPLNQDKKEPPLKPQMDQLNKDRIDFKHYGNLPAQLTAREHALNSEDFLRKSMDVFFGVEFDNLSRADLLTDNKIKEIIKNAERHFADSEYPECMGECAKAHSLIKISFNRAFFEGKFRPHLSISQTGKMMSRPFVEQGATLPIS